MFKWFYFELSLERGEYSVFQICFHPQRFWVASRLLVWPCGTELRNLDLAGLRVVPGLVSNMGACGCWGAAWSSDCALAAAYYTVAVLAPPALVLTEGI